MAEDASTEAPGTAAPSAPVPAASPPSPGAAEAGQRALLSNDGGLMDWRQGFPEDVRTAPILQRFSSAEQAARALIEQDGMLGRAIFLPDRRSYPKDSDGYRDGLQKVTAKLRDYDPELAPPTKAEEYQWQIPEGAYQDEHGATFWKNVFHDAQITQGQAGKLMQAYYDRLGQLEREQAGRAELSYAEGRDRLFREFGGNTQHEISLAQEFVNYFGRGAFGGEAGAKFWDEVTNAIDPATGARLINSPHMVAVFADANRHLVPGEFREGGHQVGVTSLQAMETDYRALTARRLAHGMHGGDGADWTPDDEAKWQAFSQQMVRARAHAQAQNGRR